MKNYQISTHNISQHTHDLWFLLKECFWANNISLEQVEKFINHSLCFGIFYNPECKLIGFGRVITDFTTYGYICDVVINQAHRRKGLASMLIQTIMEYPELKNLPQWSLRTTEEAKPIYSSHGFLNIKNSEILERNVDD